MSTKTKILYVDDEDMNLQLFEANLYEEYDVLTAIDGLKGLEILEKNPDILVVISDMKMPYMNGVEFIEKAKEKYPYMKFYILTGFEITDEIQGAIDTKLILDYFKKPFDMNMINKTITEAIG